MASWGEFIREVPILNRKSEGIFVKVDHVIDLWEERNKLRLELDQLKAGGASPGEPVRSELNLEIPTADQVEAPQEGAGERERCAREIEAFAETFDIPSEYQPFAVELLQAAAQHLREKNEVDVADFLAGVEIPPSARPAEPVEEAVPLAEALPEGGGAGPA